MRAATTKTTSAQVNSRPRVSRTKAGTSAMRSMVSWFAIVKIGSVIDQRIDPETYLAIVTMRVDSRISHGPRALADLTWPPTLARVASTLELEHPAVRFAGVQADTRIGWNGERLTRVIWDFLALNYARALAQETDP